MSSCSCSRLFPRLPAPSFFRSVFQWRVLEDSSYATCDHSVRAISKSLGGYQSQSGRFGYKYNRWPLSGGELRFFGHPTLGVVSTVTELPFSSTLRSKDYPITCQACMEGRVLKGLDGQRHPRQRYTAPPPTEVHSATQQLLYSRERYVIPCMVLGVDLNGYVISRPPPKFDHRTIQPVAGRYTDYALRAAP